MHKQVLMFANDFPPIGGAGVQRAVYFAKYLPTFGWDPTVITVKEVEYPTKDQTLLGKLPAEVQVERTESFELRRLLWLWRRARGRLRRGGERGDRPTEPPEPAGVDAHQRDLGRALKRWLFVPDDRILWAPFALTRAFRVIRRVGIDALYATTPCYSTGVIGHLASRISGLPLVLDLRDPWSMDPYLPSPTTVHAWLDSRLEAAALRSANRIVVSSEAMREGFRDKYPELPADRIIVITNGYDGALFADVEAMDSGGRFTVAYVGSLYAHHRSALRSFCAAWTRAAEADSVFADTATLWLVGRCDPEIRRELEAWEKVPAEIFGYRPHAEGLARLKGASALLLLIRDLDPERELVTIPGKLFEYLAAGLPIVMIGPPGDASRIVADAGGRVHREGDVTGIAETLSSLHRGVAAGKEGRAEASVPPPEYDRRGLTGRLAAQLDAVSDTSE